MFLMVMFNQKTKESDERDAEKLSQAGYERMR